MTRRQKMFLLPNEVRVVGDVVVVLYTTCIILQKKIYARIRSLILKPKHIGKRGLSFKSLSFIGITGYSFETKHHD